MSPVVDLQRRLRQIGRIRLGDKGDKGQPQKLAHFRLTSPTKAHIDAAAAAFGGTPRPWTSPQGDAWELYTQTDAIEVAIPPGENTYSSWLELWTGGGCVRRCDGVRVLVTEGKRKREAPCICAANGQTGKARECKLTTRLNVMLPAVPVLGTWRLDSLGFYAAIELPGVLDTIQAARAAGVILPGTLRIEQRVTKRPGERTNRYVVPVLDVSMPLAELMGMSRTPAAIEAREVKALPAPRSEPEPPPLPEEMDEPTVEVLPPVDAEPALPPPREVIHYWPSEGTPGVDRAVVTVDDLRQCTCEAFTYSEAPKRCKHTEWDEAGPYVWLTERFPALTPNQIGERLREMKLTNSDRLLEPGVMRRVMAELERCSLVPKALAEDDLIQQVNAALRDNADVADTDEEGDDGD